MKWLLVGAILAVTPAAAKDAVLSCFTDDTHQHLIILGKENEKEVHLQWDGGPFYYGTVDYTDNTNRYMLIQQFGNKGTFRMVFDVKTFTGYGGTVFYNGTETKSPFTCVWQ
jgi:hypothetical protein